MIPCIQKIISWVFDLTQNKHSNLPSEKMKLALLVIATLALVCLSWANGTEESQKDVKLPGKIELKL